MSLLRTIAIATRSRSFCSNSSSSRLVDDICRVLSDHRSPDHDLESALLPFAASLSSDPSLLDHLLRRCSHLPSPCHRLFLFSSSPSPLSHRILLSIFARSRLFPLFWAHLSDHKPLLLPHLRDLFHLVFRAYADARLPDDAIRSFHRMPDFGLDPQAQDLNLLLFALCRRKSFFREAHRFFNLAKSDFSPDNKPYTILINAADNATDALNLFDEMRQRDERAADTVACNALIAALCRAGEMDEAFKRLKEMKLLYSLEPDAASLSVFVRSYCDSKDAHSALRMLENMRRKNLSPNVYTYNCVIKLLCETEKTDEAYEILDEMITGGEKPDVWSYNTILAVHCRLHEANKAIRLMKRMDTDECLPDRHTYNMIMKMLIGVGRIDWAMEVWDGMEKRGFYPSASSYAVMIHGLCRKKGRAEDASRYFEVMVEEGVPPYLATCELLRDELLRLGLRERVEVLSDRMRRSTSCTIQELASNMEGRKRRGNAAVDDIVGCEFKSNWMYKQQTEIELT